MASISALGVGSGLDLNGLLDQLKAGENQKLVPLANRKKSYQARISAFGTLQSALDGFRTAVAKLGEKDAFQAVKSTVSGDALAATTTSRTPPGDYVIHVGQLARNSSVATTGVADDEVHLGGGSIDFTLANGESLTVEIPAGASRITDIRDAINERNGGVRASVVNDGSGQPYRLVLGASEPGTEAAVAEIHFNGDLGGALQLDEVTRQEARDAELTINGIAVRSAGNRVEGAIQGATLNLAETGDATLQVTRDDEAVKDAVTSLVEKYNKLVDTFGDLTRYDQESGVTGVLLGNGTVRQVQSGLRSAMGMGIAGNGDFHALRDIGLELKLDGTIEIDDKKLTKAVTEGLDDLKQFFVGTTGNKGFAGELDDLLGSMTDDAGLIDDATDGLKESIKQLDEQYARTQARIEDTMARYRRQFSQLDSLIAQMNSTSSYLAQQFDALSQIGGGN